MLNLTVHLTKSLGMHFVKARHGHPEWINNANNIGNGFFLNIAGAIILDAVSCCSLQKEM